MGLQRYCCLLPFPSHTPFCVLWLPTFIRCTIYPLSQPSNTSLVTERIEAGVLGSLGKLYRAGGEKLQGEKHALEVPEQLTSALH